MQPNILHIFVDQQRFDTIGALGNPIIKTPHLDRLARQGVAFASAYTACPVCIAARCSMIYGQYPLHTGCYENAPMPEDGRPSFMDALVRAGYSAHGIGKCHFHPDPHALRGFLSREEQEEVAGEGAADSPYYQMLREEGYDYVLELNGSRSEMYYIPQISQLPERLHPSAWIADRAIAHLRAQKESGRPWYLFASFIHPHPPFSPPNPWHKLYRAAQMPLPLLPPEGDALLTFVNRIQNRYKYRDGGLDFHLLRTMKAYYYACISFVDCQVGRILDALEQTGQAENTLVLFTADHGEHLGDYGCFGKRTFHDTAARVPLLAWQKGRFEGGRVCDTPVSLVDLAPTILAAAGVQARDMALDGEDLAAILSGQSPRRMVFGQHSYAQGNPLQEPRQRPPRTPEEAALLRASLSSYMAVSPEWKYFYSAPDGQEYLFDRKADPRETRNRAGAPFCQAALTEMRAALIAHLRAGGETAGLDGEHFRAFPPFALPRNPDAGLLVQDGYVPWARKADDLKAYRD